MLGCPGHRWGVRREPWGVYGVPRGVQGTGGVPGVPPEPCPVSQEGVPGASPVADGAGGSGRVRALQQEVQGVTSIMSQNLERILARGENLEQLHSKSQDLEATVRGTGAVRGHGVPALGTGSPGWPQGHQGGQVVPRVGRIVPRVAGLSSGPQPVSLGWQLRCPGDRGVTTG